MKEIINNKQAASILILFLIGSTLVLGTGAAAEQDAWISILLAVLLFVPIGLIYVRITRLYPEKNIYDIIIEVFGKIGGTAVILLYIFYSVHLGALVIRNFSEFISILSMPETPQIILQIFLTGFSIWMVKSGIEVLGRWSKFVLPTVLLAVFATLLISLKDIDFSYMKPIGGAGFRNILSGVFSAFSFPIAESVLFLSVYGSLENNKNRNYIYFWSMLVGLIVIITAMFRNLLILGVPNLGMVYFPSYSSVSIISLGEFLTRIEVLIGINFLIAGAVKISICLFSACIGFAKIVNRKDYHVYVMPMGLIMMTLAVIVYHNTVEMFTWLEIYQYYAFPFQVIFPIAIWVKAEIINFNKKTS